MGIEKLDVLPFAPTLLGLTIGRDAGQDGPITIIGRRFDRPQDCRLCPGRRCMALDAGFCVVTARGHIPDELCPGYVQPRPGIGL